MEITLNSPKYAEAQSLQYQMHKKQQDRKKRKNFTPELFERYYRRNEATTDYATMPAVTLSGDFVIEFDVLSDNDDSAYMILGNNGGTQNCIFITNNDISVRDNSGSTVFSNGDYLQPLEIHSVKITKIDGVVEIFIDGVSRGGGASSSSYIFNMLYTRQAGVFILQGILANLKIWDNGTLIRDYPLDDNSDDLRERVSGQNGTVINGNASDWGLFQQQVTGEWLGQELVVNGGFDSDSDWTKGAGWYIGGGLASSTATSNSAINQAWGNAIGATYRTMLEIAGYSSGNVQYSLDGGVGSKQSSVGVFTEDLVTTGATSQVFLVADFSSGFIGSIDNVSVKEVLNVA